MWPCDALVNPRNNTVLLTRFRSGPPQRDVPQQPHSVSYDDDDDDDEDDVFPSQGIVGNLASGNTAQTLARAILDPQSRACTLNGSHGPPIPIPPSRTF
ncbi:hypothetical protein CRUP_003127 [Coryphaenoides rupestris]|nr:hypothetical protein CRUP_003127 [Coryphaenoides rupestris]